MRVGWLSRFWSLGGVSWGAPASLVFCPCVSPVRFFPSLTLLTALCPLSPSPGAFSPQGLSPWASICCPATAPRLCLPSAPLSSFFDLRLCSVISLARLEGSWITFFFSFPWGFLMCSSLCCAPLGAFLFVFEGSVPPEICSPNVHSFGAVCPRQNTFSWPFAGGWSLTWQWEFPSLWFVVIAPLVLPGLSFPSRGESCHLGRVCLFLVLW